MVRKKMFLQNSQNSQENICVLQLYQKAPTQVFSCEIPKIFTNVYFEEHLQTTASEL